ncbi:MAG: retropepsin-like aspartic protease family protein [Alphaproteobacteria bacterium]
MLARFAMITGVTIVVAVTAVEIVPRMDGYLSGGEAVTAPPSAAAVARPRAPTVSGRRLVVEADRSGHFSVEALVSGRRVDLMVDTGATLVALNAATAQRLGLRVREADYRKAISTANGVVRAAPVVLSELRVGGIRVRDVDAVVIAGEALPINLLGMSFLGRLSQFEMARGRLVLSQ